VHVDDLCEGVIKATLSPARSGSIFFIAENRSYAMGELIDLLRQACGVRTVPLYLPGPVFRATALFSELLFGLVGAAPMLTREKAREMLASWEVTTHKAKDEIGYESKIPFAGGVAQTLSWYRKQGWLS
jgi:nucleoside-diphosphate-sugar epimerase